jgi:hypothetical protein
MPALIIIIISPMPMIRLVWQTMNMFLSHSINLVPRCCAALCFY